MHNQGKKGFIMALAIIFIAASCSKVNDIEIRNVNNLKFKGIQENMVNFDADLQIFNPSHRNIKVKEIDVRLIVNDVYVGRLMCENEIHIPSDAETFITVPFRLRITNLLSGISTLNSLSQQKDVKVHAEGFVKAGAGLLQKKIKVDKTTLIGTLNN